MTTNESAYFAAAMPYDPRRDLVWRVVLRYLGRFMRSPEVVLEVGAGHCHFINQVTAPRRIALDPDPVVSRYAAPGVEVVRRSCTARDAIALGSVDVVFASNLLEHLTRDDIATFLANARAWLRPNGLLLLVQPNYRYAYREYFDDYTHVTPLDHVSLPQMLSANGFDVEHVEPRFLPYSMQSGLPVAAWLVALYLRAPLRPLAKQMLCVARRRAP